MMRKLVFTSLFLLTSVYAFAQFYDNYWMTGYYGGTATPPTDSFGVSVLSFYDAELRVENNQGIDMFIWNGIALSDYHGNLLLYSNNQEIRDSSDRLIINGFFEEHGDSEQIQPQTFVMLPYADHDLVQYVNVVYDNGFPRRGQNFSAYLINTSGPLEVYDQLTDILPGGLVIGELTACRHANGRDWWVVVARADEPVVYTVLFCPEGVTMADSVEVNYEMVSGLGRACFSPDGKHYVRYNGVRIGEDSYLDVFTFDRTTGSLTDHRQARLEDQGIGGGVAISPSSRYLYVADAIYIFQYDLLAEDVFATKDTVAVYDGYAEFDFYATRFFMPQLAVDGKIYVNSFTSTLNLHVIEFPDKQGIECEVRQRAVALPNWDISTLDNHPNYRLGPIDGSSADTLGIDNLPRAFYRTDRSTEDTLAFHFQDLSFYEPTTWWWTFGDGGTSTDRHPDHIYASPGIYEVCLTVSNDLGSDTECRTLELGTSSFGTPVSLQVSIFPNPVQDVLVFDLGDYLPLNGQFKLYDAAGRLVLTRQVLYRQERFDFRVLPLGMYYYEFWDGGEQLGAGMVVKGS